MYDADESEVAEKAKKIRYKKGALFLIQRNRIVDCLYEIQDECCSLLYEEDREAMLKALGGDEEELDEIKFCLTDLEGKIEILIERIKDSYVTEHFDDYLVGSLGRTQYVVGYDTFENDYFNLTKYDAELAQRESGKRLMRLTKEQIIAIGGQCFGILISFLDLRNEYDCLTSVFGLVKNERKKLLNTVSSITDAYDEWAAIDEPSYNKEKMAAARRLDNTISLLPDYVWAV